MKTANGHLSFGCPPTAPTIDDFTIECFIRVPSLPAADAAFIIFELGPSLELYFAISNSVSFGTYGLDVRINATLFRVAWTPTYDTWYHVAATRSGSTVQLFVDGSSIGTDTISGSINSTDWRIAGRPSISEGVLGHLDELRFSDIARTVSVPGSAYTSDGNTLILAHFDGTDGDTTFIDSSSYARTLTPTGDSQIDTAQSKFGGASGLFDGDDYIQVSA